MIDLHGLTGKGALYFVRHGQTEDHKHGLIKGLTDCPLSRGGIAQAEATGGWFSGVPVNFVFCSPLTRARETAEIISARIEKPAGVPEIAELTELRELNTGIFTGLTQIEAAEKYPKEYASFSKASWEGVPGAEKIDFLTNRIGCFWNMIFEHVAKGDQNILCVIHKGIFQWIIRATLDGKGWMPLFEIDFCGTYRLSYDMTGGKYFAVWDMLNFTAWD